MFALQVFNESGDKRVIVTKDLPGDRWRNILTAANCRVEVCTSPDVILDNATVKKLIGDKCDGVIGQLTEVSVKLCVGGKSGETVRGFVKGVLLAGDWVKIGCISFQGMAPASCDTACWSRLPTH